MNYYWHCVLQQTYVLLDHKLIWSTLQSDGALSRLRSISCFARHSPDRGYPERECGPVPIYEATFRGYIQEISRAFAWASDPELVCYCDRLARCPRLPEMLSNIPRDAHLQLVWVQATAEGSLFDVYQTRRVERAQYLNPLLAHFLRHRTFLGAPRLLVPGCLDRVRAGELLVEAICMNLWGASQTVSLTAQLV